MRIRNRLKPFAVRARREILEKHPLPKGTSVTDRKAQALKRRRNLRLQPRTDGVADVGERIGKNAGKRRRDALIRFAGLQRDGAVSARDGGTGNPDRARIFLSARPSARYCRLPQNTRKDAFRTGTNATHSKQKSQSARQTSHVSRNRKINSDATLPRSNSGMNSCF